MRTLQSVQEGGGVAPGEVVICGYPSQCSACLGLGRDDTSEGVILANITTPSNIANGGWHGYWFCTKHWAKPTCATRLRYEATGSATPPARGRGQA